MLGTGAKLFVIRIQCHFMSCFGLVTSTNKQTNNNETLAKSTGISSNMNNNIEIDSESEQH